MQYKISQKEEKITKTGKPYIRATLTDEQGKVYPGISAFNGEFNVSDVWHGEIEQNGQYYNLVTPKKSSGASFIAAQKTQQIEKAMDKKAEQIHQAQDRSAWMWAKTNASTLLAGSGIGGTSIGSIANNVIHLATLIYNGEPTEPFTSPKPSMRTSPSEDYPEGIDLTNHPLLEEDDLKNIPF